MEETGIVRRIDDLGRVVIPKSARKDMGVTEGDPLEIYQMGECVILRKYQEDGKPPTLKELDEAHMLAHRRGEALGAANRQIDQLLQENTELKKSIAGWARQYDDLASGYAAHECPKCGTDLDYWGGRASCPNDDCDFDRPMTPEELED